MALKNTYTTMPLNRIMEKLSKVLVDHNASKIMIDYDSNKLPFKISFIISHEAKEIPIILPARPEKVFAYMNRQRVRTNVAPELAVRVAWRNILDWVEAQMALIEIDQAEMFEVFMPYLAMKDGKTLFESHKDQILNLPENGN
jgi:hypothetical protein